MAERDQLAEAAYEHARATANANYAVKAMEKQAELAFRRLDTERAGTLWRECSKKFPKSSAGRNSTRALTRHALVGKPGHGVPVHRGKLCGRAHGDLNVELLLDAL